MPGKKNERDEAKRAAGCRSRRFVVPGRRHRARNVQHVDASWLSRGWLTAHHREQPGRLHDRPDRFAFDAVRERRGQGLRDADRARERRRRGGVPQTVRLAVAYRNSSRKDFVIDLVGYRRTGHNETDSRRSRSRCCTSSSKRIRRRVRSWAAPRSRAGGDRRRRQAPRTRRLAKLCRPTRR